MNKVNRSTAIAVAAATAVTALVVAGAYAYDSSRDNLVAHGVQEPYRYEKEVEDFLRWSPSVRNRTNGEEPPRYFPPAPRKSKAETAS